MRKTVTIQIPKPCHEDWNTMTAVEKGRHCTSCSKTVFDFTNTTDEKIIETFETEGHVCGRFKNTQLNRELVLSRKEKNNFRTFLASGFLAFLTFGSQKSQAQNKPVIVQTDSSNAITVKGKQAVSVLNNKLVSGTVYDENGLPLPGANIIVKGTSIGTQTDFDGNFKINAKKGQILAVSFVGYVSEKITLENASKIELNLKPDLTSIQEIIIGGFVSISYRTKNYSYGFGYEYINNYSFFQASPSQEQIEKERVRKLRWKNFSTFYKRKNRESRKKI